MRLGKSLQWVSHFNVFLLVIIFGAQHTLLCTKVAAAPLASESSYTTIVQNEKDSSETGMPTMGIDCSHPCHFNTMSALLFYQDVSLVPKDYQSHSTPFSLKEVVFSIFHPPTLL